VLDRIKDKLDNLDASVAGMKALRAEVERAIKEFRAESAREIIDLPHWPKRETKAVN
jgi:hypothetical protein